MSAPLQGAFNDICNEQYKNVKGQPPAGCRGAGWKDAQPAKRRAQCRRHLSFGTFSTRKL
jgi:hypothetical protein